MKNDINLLYKRKVKTYSNKNIFMVFLTVLLIGVMAFFAIKLPSDSLQAVKIKATKINNDLAASSVDNKDLAVKTQQKDNLDTLLASLNALKESRADIINYVEVIESQRPSNIFIRKLSTDPTGLIHLSGVTNSDKAIAVFCLKLREQNIFKDVFLLNSTTDLYTGVISFGITITLPASLDSITIIQGIQQTDDIAIDAKTGEENAK